MGIPRAECASALELNQMQTAELHSMIAALVDSEEDPGTLLCAAAKEQLVPEALRAAPDWTKSVRILHNIMMPNPGSGSQYLTLPECKLRLRVHQFVKGMQRLCAIRMQAQITEQPACCQA